MAVTFTILVEGDEATGGKLQEIRDRLGIRTDEDVAPGMLAHLESVTPTGYRIVDVWESEADFERFFQDRLGKAFEDSGFSPLQGRPDVERVFSLVQRQRIGSYDAMVRELLDAFTRNDPAVLDRHLHPEFVDHAPLQGIPADREGVKQAVAQLHAAFEGFTMTPLEVVSAPGRAASRCLVTGRQVGDFMGIPATGRSAEVEADDFFAIDADGRIREHWGIVDTAALMMQLGALPAQAGAPAMESTPQKARR